MNSNPYEDIIDKKRPISQRHPTMPMRDRAAQFAPFAALAGHNRMLEETRRRVEDRMNHRDVQKEEE